jgi:hypothetical protein
MQFTFTGTDTFGLRWNGQVTLVGFERTQIGHPAGCTSWICSMVCHLPCPPICLITFLPLLHSIVPLPIVGLFNYRHLFVSAIILCFLFSLPHSFLSLHYFPCDNCFFIYSFLCFSTLSSFFFFSFVFSLLP